MPTKDNQNKRNMARQLFMSGMEQKEISVRLSVSANTVSRWAQADGWRETRAAKSLSRPELVNRLLSTISAMIEQINVESIDTAGMGAFVDRLTKISAVIERLDKRTNVVDAIEVFIAFGKWLEYRASTDAEITVEFLKKLNKYQDLYISEKITSR